VVPCIFAENHLTDRHLVDRHSKKGLGNQLPVDGVIAESAKVCVGQLVFDQMTRNQNSKLIKGLKLGQSQISKHINSEFFNYKSGHI
jgi:hypothetical protein